MLRLPRCAALLMLPAAAFALAQDGPREGKWEYQSETKIPGMVMPQLPPGVQLPPGMSMPGMGAGGGIKSTFAHCVTKDDLVPKSSSGKEKCEVKKQERKGNTVIWAVACTTPEGKMDGEGTATYTGDTMSSTMKMKGTSNGQPMEMSQTMTGRYLGACDKK